MSRSISTTTLTLLGQFYLLPIMVSGVVCISSPLVSNVFLAQYDSGTFLSHLTDGGYGFDAIGSPGFDMYQMYIVAPMVKAGMTYVGVGLIYKPHGLFSGNVERCATFLRTFSIDVKVKSMWPLVRHTSFERGGVWDLSVTLCQLGSVSTPSFPVQV